MAEPDDFTWSEASRWSFLSTVRGVFQGIAGGVVVATLLGDVAFSTYSAFAVFGGIVLVLELVIRWSVCSNRL